MTDDWGTGVMADCLLPALEELATGVLLDDGVALTGVLGLDFFVQGEFGSLSIELLVEFCLLSVS